MYTLSAPRKSGYKETFATLTEVREKAADLLSDMWGETVVTPETMIEIDAGDSTVTWITYCYASQEDAEDDEDGAYAVKYWRER
jgi:hypothetical protein